MALARLCWILCFCTLFSLSCSTVPKETREGRRVQIIKSPFAETCIQLGKFKYEGTPFIGEKELTIVMKELAAQLKGNAMKLEIFTPGVRGMSNAKGRGIAYRCQVKKLKKYILKQDEKEFDAQSSKPKKDEDWPEDEETGDEKEIQE